MKKNILVFVAFAAQISFAQSTFPTDGGNVGIGTLAPNSRLTVRLGSTGVSIHPGSGGNSYFGSIAFNRESATGEIFDNRAYAFQINNGNNTYDKNLHFQIYNSAGTQISNNALVINGATGGNIGIGTADPSALLDIYSPLPLVGSYDTQKWSTSNVDYSLKLQTIWNYSGINQEFIQRFNGIDYKSLVFFHGNVGIGISNPENKLDVSGTIHAKEVKVDLNFPAPDYVFANDYKLKSLQEVEEYTKSHHHLPEIPSAKELQKDGINVAEMNMALLKKVEELTLYVIEQQKNTQQLIKVIQEQKRRLGNLENIK